MAQPGIDYGCGMVNVDHATGIRYGVISQGSVLQAWADSAEPDYGEASCPKCGNAVKDTARVDTEGFETSLELRGEAGEEPGH